jgi:apolipoprotein N-acyltransferase
MLTASVLIGGGAAGALALPPYGFIPCFVLSLCVLVWMLDDVFGVSASRRRRCLSSAFLTGWLWGLGYCLGGLWWLGAGFRFLAVPDIYFFVLIPGIVAFCAFLALFYGFGTMVAGLLWSPGSCRVFALAFGISSGEWLRGHVLTGFPWNLPGMVFGQHLALMQAASVGGVYLLTVIVLLICAAPSTLRVNRGVAQTATFNQRGGPTVIAAAALILLAICGYTRARGELPPVDGVKVRVVQPDVQQDDKFRPDNAEAILATYFRVSLAGRETLDKDITHVVWPETAFPYVLDRSPETIRRTQAFLHDRAVLVAGSARFDPMLPGEERARVFNSIAVVDKSGHVWWVYDKMHLVPFGEMVPAFVVQVLRFLDAEELFVLPGDYHTPLRRKTALIPGVGAVAASICYESVFSADVLPQDMVSLPEELSLQFMLNVTNDGWFDGSNGPYQHFAQARLRAVEEGLSLVRAANTGISAVIDGYGRMVAVTPAGGEAIIDGFVPQRLENRTVFARWRHVPFWLVMVLCLSAALAGRVVSCGGHGLSAVRRD